MSSREPGCMIISLDITQVDRKVVERALLTPTPAARRACERACGDASD